MALGRPPVSTSPRAWPCWAAAACCTWRTRATMRCAASTPLAPWPRWRATSMRVTRTAPTAPSRASAAPAACALTRLVSTYTLRTRGTTQCVASWRRAAPCTLWRARWGALPTGCPARSTARAPTPPSARPVRASSAPRLSSLLTRGTTCCGQCRRGGL